nr:unnamed protein product [Spirometra erinaceieuropaei]
MQKLTFAQATGRISAPISPVPWTQRRISAGYTMFTTTDVYSAASAIGQELQLLIDEFGPDDVESFMFKVITVLEDLEACVNMSTEMEEKVNTLREKLESLRSDRQQFSDSRDNYAMNLEQLQQSWYKDTSALFDEAAALEAENDRLKQKLESMRTRPDAGEGTEDEDARAHETKSKISALVNAISRGAVDKSSSMTAATALSDAGVKKHVDDIVSMTEQRLGLSKQEDRAADLQLIRLLKAVISEQSSEMRQLRLTLLQHEASIDAAEEEVCRLAHQSGTLLAGRAPHRRQAGQLAAEKAEVEAKLCVCEQELKELSHLIELQDLQSEATATELARQSLKPAPANMPLHISPCQGAESVETASGTAYPEDSLLSLEELRSLFYERNELRCRLIELEATLQLAAKEENEELLFGPLPCEPIEKLRPGFAASQTGIKPLFIDLLRRIAEKAQRSK